MKLLLLYGANSKVNISKYDDDSIHRKEGKQLMELWPLTMLRRKRLSTEVKSLNHRLIHLVGRRRRRGEREIPMKEKDIVDKLID